MFCVQFDHWNPWRKNAYIQYASYQACTEREFPDPWTPQVLNCIGIKCGSPGYPFDKYAVGNVGRFSRRRAQFKRRMSGSIAEASRETNPSHITRGGAPFVARSIWQATRAAGAFPMMAHLKFKFQNPKAEKKYPMTGWGWRSTMKLVVLTWAPDGCFWPSQTVQTEVHPLLVTMGLTSQKDSSNFQEARTVALQQMTWHQNAKL